jgi:hypothetical protein
LEPDEFISVEDAPITIQTGEIPTVFVIGGVTFPKGDYVVEKRVAVEGGEVGEGGHVFICLLVE